MRNKIKKALLSKTSILVFSLVLTVGMVGGAYLYKVAKVDGYCTFYGMRCFGGKVNSVELCCNGLLLHIGEPRDGDFLLTSDTMLYMWWNFWPRQCVTGDAYPYGVCISPWSWPPCTRTEEVDGIIRQMGTTLVEPVQFCNQSE